MMRAHRSSWFLSAVALAALSLAACTGAVGPAGKDGLNGTNGTNGKDGTNGTNGKDGTNGTNGKDGTSAATTGTLTVTVTDAVAKDMLAGVTVNVKDSGGTVLGTGTTDNTGKASIASVPAGTVVLSLAKTNYTAPGDTLVGVLAGMTVNVSAALSEAASGKPSVALALKNNLVPNDFGYGAQVTVVPTATSPTGSTLTYTWKNATLPALGTVAGNQDNSALVTLPAMTDAMARRYETAKPSNQYLSGYVLQNRPGVIPVLADTRGEMSVSLTVADNRGQSTTVSITLDAASIVQGSGNVPIGTRVYVNSGHVDPNAWTIDISGAAGSKAALDSASIRTPSFVADVKGVYKLTETNSKAVITVYAGDWVGAIKGGAGSSGTETVVPDNACTDNCHKAGGFAPDVFTPWQKTNHAIMFAKGLVGDNGNHYGGSCLGCHTVGYDTGVVNNGFDDQAAAASWTFPNNNYAATNWTDFVSKQPLALVRLSNIQCESCHGPQGSGGHANANSPNLPADPYTREYGNPRISMAAEVCGTCHAAGTGHHNYSEWQTVDAKTGWGHSNRATTSFGAGAGGLNGHCGRCHTAQGFVQYADQIQSGNPGNLLVTAGVTPANAEPVTCTACHDPHDASNPSQLRLYGDTPLLPAGFSMYGLGKGALCITCHNSRNGTYVANGKFAGTYLHEDGESFNAGNPTGYSAPHQACQGDVFAGHNAYFMGNSLPMTSRHAAIEDACVGCHMAKNPETHLSHGAPAVSGHVFRITDDNKGALCAQCHAVGVNGEGIQGQVEAGLAAISAKMNKAIVAKINAAPITVVAYDAATDSYSIAPGAAKNPGNLVPIVVDTSKNPLVSAAIEEIHGQVGFLLTFTSPISVQLVDSNGVATKLLSTTSFGVQMGSILDTQLAPKPIYALTGKLVRAGWNYFLIEGDQSKGLHNPTFANAVINNTLAQDLSQ